MQAPGTENRLGAGVTVDIQYACRRSGLPDAQRIRKWARTALGRGRPHGELTVRIVNEKESAELNRHWRHRSGATNVLSFPAKATGVVPEPLGDIVICAPVVRREAREQGKAPEAHWAHMVIHGTLHLLGFDHEKAKDARTMESFEIRLLEKLGFANPYS
ncbi:MAG: rRNA maturation RNase YbeY [Gammaproteobacteria bacterium]|nr:rRNA maturation RNase YbeY [Gammaproteobacteria bacterium]